MIFYGLDLFCQNIEVCLFQNLVVALNRIHKMEPKKWKCCHQNSPPIVNLCNMKERYSKLTEAATRSDLLKKGDLKFFPKFTGKHLCWSLLFKNIYFEEHLRTTSSKFIYYTHVLLSLNFMMYYISYNI